jgi:hypothetical protein
MYVGGSQVFSLLALLVQKYKYCSTSGAIYVGVPTTAEELSCRCRSKSSGVSLCTVVLVKQVN